MITRTLVSEKSRPEFLPKYFGSHFCRFEELVYAFMDTFCEDYSGGYWDYYELSNGGVYMSLSSSEALKVSNDFNQFEGEMSPDAASIAINMFAINALMDSPNPEPLIELYYHLREYGAEHKEIGSIFRMID